MKIADILQARKRTEDLGLIVPIIEERIMIDGMTDSRKRRRDVVHPSEVCSNDFCPREWLYCQRDPELYNRRRVNVQTQKRFDIGTLLHKYIQDKLGSAGVLFGMWECLRRCEDEKCIQVGFKPTSDACSKPHALWIYREPTIQDEDLNLYGNVDGIVVFNNRKFSLEFKSMNTNAFSTLVEPVSRDREQSFWYLDTLIRKGFLEWNTFLELESNGIIDKAQEIMNLPYDGSILLYMDKNTQEFNEFTCPRSLLSVKEFMVEKDDSLNHIIETKKNMLRTTIEHLEAGTLCDRLVVCTEKTDRRVRFCRAKSICFS